MAVPMRKATIEIAPHAYILDFFGNFLEVAERIEIMQMLRIDFERGIKLAICRICLKKGYVLDDLHCPLVSNRIIDVLNADGSDYICLVKGNAPSKFMPIMKEFDLDLVWVKPSYITHEKIVYSCIGDQPSLKIFIERIKFFGKIISISCQRVDCDFLQNLSCITDKQRAVLIEAKKSGYYDYPRKINAGQLAERLGIGKSATIEHLRKAEKRIISQVLSGY
jgi:hypothetical protein